MMVNSNSKSLEVTCGRQQLQASQVILEAQGAIDSMMHVFLKAKRQTLHPEFGFSKLTASECSLLKTDYEVPTYCAAATKHIRSASQPQEKTS